MTEPNSPSITGIDKAKCLLDLQRTLAENRRQTRHIEIWVNISLWTLIAASVKFFHDINEHLSNHYVWFVLIALAVYVVHFSWMMLIQGSENRDGKRIRKWSEIVENECGILEEQGQKYPKTLWWVLVETLVTLILLAIAGIALW